MIPLIISWFTSKPGKEQVALWIQLSAHAALERNDVGMMIALYQTGMPFDTVEASPLLYRVIDENKNPDFVPFLVHYLKADSNFSPDGKRTLLIKAVEDNNMPLVHMLLEHGADPDIILDSQIGSAQQIAFERGYTPIELRLRQKR